MVNARVFHAKNDLEDEVAFGGDFEKRFDVGMGEVEGLVAGVDADAGHFVDFVAAAEVFLPIGPGEVDGPEWNQEAAMLLAFGGEAFVDAVYVFGEEGVEAAGPRLNDAQLFL